MAEEKTFGQLFVEETNRKQQLAQKILGQMGPDHENKKISDITMSQVKLAIDNFEACIQRCRSNNAEEAIYFFSRGCWNLGEAMGRAKVENPKRKEFLPPETAG